MRFARLLIGFLPSLVVLALPQLATAVTSDSSYSSPDLLASTSSAMEPSRTGGRSPKHEHRAKSISRRNALERTGRPD